MGRKDIPSSVAGDCDQRAQASPWALCISSSSMNKWPSQSSHKFKIFVLKSQWRFEFYPLPPHAVPHILMRPTCWAEANPPWEKLLKELLINLALTGPTLTLAVAPPTDCDFCLVKESPQGISSQNILWFLFLLTLSWKILIDFLSERNKFSKSFLNIFICFFTLFWDFDKFYKCLFFNWWHYC